jgi:hypothetical protein
MAITPKPTKAQNEKYNSFLRATNRVIKNSTAKQAMI